MAMLVLHAVSGLFLMRIITAVPCSNDKYAARFIEDYCPAGCTIVSSSDAFGAAVSGYLGGRPIFYVNRQAFGTFRALDATRFHPHGLPELVEAAHRFDRPIILADAPATPEEENSLNLKLLRSFSGSMVPDEAYYIYVFDRP
jgi:hypothetical protein